MGVKQSKTKDDEKGIDFEYIFISEEVFNKSDLRDLMTYEEFLSVYSNDEETPISSLTDIMSPEEKAHLKKMGII